MFRLSVYASMFCFAVAAYAADNPIAFGPYVQNVTDDGAVICWSTHAGEVQLITPKGEKSKSLYDHHELPLTRLSADTEYSYDVLKDGSDFGKGTFRTFSEGIEPFRFVVYGDTRSDPVIHQKIVDIASAEEPRLIINTGDLVANGLEIDDWEIFFDINRDLMKGTPYYPVLGNHEKNADYYFEFFNLPGNERYYEFFVGDVLFLMLDSEGSDFGKPEYVKNSEYYWNNYQKEYFEKQKEWVENMLDLHKDAGYVFAFFHQPLISLKSGRVEDAKDRRKFWGDTFSKHGVQAVICGHDHHYHRAEADGVTLVTSGGGGAGLYDGDVPAPETITYKKVNHLITVDVGEEEAKMKVTEIDGTIIETFSVKKRQPYRKRK